MEDVAFWMFVAFCVGAGCFTRVSVAKIRARERSGYGQEDTRTTQEINRSLQQMTRRIEALETLLIENEQRSRADRVAAEIESL